MLVLAVLLIISGLLIVYEQSGWSFLPGAIHGLPGGLVAFGTAFAPLMLVSITGMIYIVEGTAMVAEHYLKRRYQQGRDEGLAAERARWTEWLARKQEAERAGRPFDEPPPSERDGP